MDSLTHVVLGHAMGIFAQSANPAVQTAAYWGAFVGNSLPDIDVPVGTLLGRGWAFHRKFTHTIPGMLLLPALATGVITWAVPGSSPWFTYAWTLAGVMLHVFLDCLNSFGTRPFKPFSNRFFGYGVLFILDPVILAVLGLGDLAHLAGWLPRAGLQGLTIAMAVYVAARWAALARLRGKLNHGEPRQTRLMVTAFLAGWRFFRERQGRLEYGSADFLGLNARVIETIEPAAGPAVEASRQVPQIARFLERARFPFARLEERDGQYRVEWEDLFQRMRGKPPTLAVCLDQNFNLIQ
ncbi:MAG TPA: metal-dependent hydrolase [Symbiobacteriaceae bacterium]|nr:metal-dependent hydrolase [Symbiobacteriaceae bacterium]